jgi:hypothetical protein
MTRKRDVYERTLRKTHPYRVLVQGLEGEARKLRRAEARARRENRILRALRRIHLMSEPEDDRERFLRIACEILIAEGAYREARGFLLPPEEVPPVGPSANPPTAPFDTLSAPLVHDGKAFGFLRVVVLPDPHSREEELPLLSMVAGDIARELGSIPERGEFRPSRERDRTCNATLRYAL